MTEWETVIGLEVHTELRTETKLFCGCRNAFGAEPNVHICPVCLGLPGALPVLNKRAVELAISIGRALDCEVLPSTFHRKNYFYPDMPKDFQITQYDEPINSHGHLDLPTGKRIGILRAHIEEDTGKSQHLGATGRIGEAESSLIDYNRAGVPLVEIVSDPDLRSAEEARAYVAELRAILVATGASDGRMEEGSLRVDANVSVRTAGTDEFGTRCEVKNMNSLRSLARAIDFEVSRQIAVIESGEAVVQETRHWDESAARTDAMRSKEEAHDYRYFPEPDLVPLVPEPSWEQAAVRLPAARREALAALTGGEVTAQILAVVEQGLDDLVTKAIEHGAPPQIALARAANDVATDVDRGKELDPRAFAALCTLEEDGALTVAHVREVLHTMLENHGGDPKEIAATKGFTVLAADSVEEILKEIIENNPDEWQRYKEGDEKLTGFFTGQVMKATNGKANGKTVAALLQALR